MDTVEKLNKLYSVSIGAAEYTDDLKDFVRLINAAPELLHEHKAWALAFGRALTDVLQGNYRRINELAHGLEIALTNGEPTIKSAVIAKAEGK